MTATLRPFGVPPGTHRSAVVDVIRRIPLQAADRDRLVLAPEHAGAFAQFLNGTNAGAGGAQQIRFEDRSRGAYQIAGRDLLDEARNVDVGGTGVRAGRVVAVQAPVRFDESFVALNGGSCSAKPAAL